ncbi:MAG: hypothetical protein EPO07_13130 [Verrucomicrobia bacterium]|nr:MAG: hypothetical protein EPO07_13130 [Verrucomicrobiota bacterium]
MDSRRAARRIVQPLVRCAEKELKMKPVSIIGGGLAGLTLGIGLRQRGVPVTIVEAGKFPRHRVCGEFISGRGLETLGRLGLRDLIERAGAVEARTAAFFNCHASSGTRNLPASALCISRFVLDDLLAREFRRLGGDWREGERWREKDFGEGVVRASGRRAHATENGCKWFGVKAHARDVSLSADLEMHVSPDGYVGLCRLAGGEVNVCGLFRQSVGSAASGAPLTPSLSPSDGERVADRPGEGNSHNHRLGTPHGLRLMFRQEANSPLRERLSAACFDETSICSVAGLSLQPRHAVERDECCIGDAVTMIPPVTGNGMSMAFESAEVAVEPLLAWSRSKTSWVETQLSIAKNCDAAFKRRLAWARWLQALVLSPACQSPLVWLAARSDFFWRFWFARTR